MQPNIHPDYHKITVKLTDGSTFETRSTYGKEGDVLALDTDIKTHPAWTGGIASVKNVGRVADFNKRFGSINFGAFGGKTEENKNEDNK
jgi:large subunit ribosomal protein L31